MKTAISIFTTLLMSSSFAGTNHLQPGDSVQLGNDTVVCQGNSSQLFRECMCKSHGCGASSTANLIFFSKLINSSGQVVHESCSVMSSESACERAVDRCR